MNSEDYGWTPEVSNWYYQALDEKNNPDAEIWSILAQPENAFQAREFSFHAIHQGIVPKCVRCCHE